VSLWDYIKKRLANFHTMTKDVDENVKIHNHNWHLYTVSLNNLVDTWVDSYHSSDHVVVVWDALKHNDFLKSNGFVLDETKIYNNKILTVQVDSLDKALEILKIFANNDGPFVQVFSLGKFITDNIDN